MSDENINVCINVVTKGSIRKAEADLKKLGDTGSKAGKNIEKSVKDADKALDAIRNNLAFITIGIAALTASVIKSINAFKQFETGLINVEKVTNISGKNLVSFGKEIDSLANRIPVATTELLNIAQTAGQLGIEGTKDILAFTEAVALLTRTTDLTIDSAQSLAQLIAVSETAPDEIGRLAAVLVELGNNFAATESQILDVSTRIAQSTTRYNILAEDSVALGTAIAAVGEKAEASGTAIGKTFRALDNAIAEGGQPLEKLIELTGLQREELDNLFKSNPTQLLRLFTEGLGEAEKAGERSAVTLETFGLKTDRVNRVLGPLIKNTDQVRKAFRLKEEQMINQNAALEEARKQFSSLESAEILTGNATTQLAKTVGEVLQPAYRSLLDTIRTVALNLTRFVEDNAPLLKTVASAIGIVSVSLTVLAAKAYFASTAFGTLKTALTALLIGNPFGIWVVGLTAVGVAIVGVINYWDQISLVLDSITVKVLDLTSIFLDFFSQFEGVGRTAIATVARAMFQFFNFTTTGLQLIAQGLDKAFGTNISESIENFKNGLKESIDQFERGNGAISEASDAVKKYRDALDASVQKRVEDNAVAEEQKQKIRELEDRREELRRIILEGSDAEGIAAQQELRNVNEQILKIRELNEEKKKVNEKEIDDNKVKIDELARIEKEYQDDLARLRKFGNDEAIKGIREVLQKEREERIKAFRDSQIKNNEFTEARRAQLELDAIEESRIKEKEAQKRREKELEEERKQQEKIRELQQEARDAEREIVITQEAIKFEKDEEELEILRQNLENQQLIKLEAQKKEAEEQGRHLEALRKQRQIDDLKRKQELTARTDSEIRQERAAAQVKRVLAQTTTEQIIGIGDNLIKAGIIQGKTAGKALKTLKTGEAIVNTYAGANLALSSSPPPFNFIAAASVIASGLANIVQIQAQKFNTGGIVQPLTGAQSRGIDQVPALLSVGEEVITRNNPRHRDNISREQDEAMLEEIRGLRSDLQNMQTIVQIDGKEVADVIQEQRFRGVN